MVGILVVGGCGLVSGAATADNEAGQLAAAGPEHVVRLGAPDDPGEGCNDEFGVTDPANLAADRWVARCATGYPQADPLDDQVELRVAIRKPHEELAPLLLADHFGELEAENVSIELVEHDDLEAAYHSLEADEVDIVAGNYHAAFFDLAAAGDGARVVMGGPVSAAAGHTSVPQAGLWMSHGAVETPGRWIELEDQTILLRDGIADVVTYPLQQLLGPADTSLNDLRVRLAAGSSAARLLAEGRVSLAWLDDPYWQRAAEQEQLGLVTTRPREALGGVVFHERLLDPEADRDIGQAFVRALLRTINTYLADPVDYRTDREVGEALVEVTGWTREELAKGPGFVFDWELRDETLERIQGGLIAQGAVGYPSALSDDGLTDTSLYLDAVSD